MTRQLVDNRLIAEPSAWALEPNEQWRRDQRSLAKYAWDLIDKDPVISSICRAWVDLSIGAAGLRHRSQYQQDELAAVTEQEQAERQRIDRLIGESYEGSEFDAAGQLDRYSLERQLAVSAFATGDGFAVRVLKGGNTRRNATAWRAIASDRVCNPPGVQDGPISDGTRAQLANSSADAPAAGSSMWQGLEIDPANNEPTAIWVRHTAISRYAFANASRFDSSGGSSTASNGDRWQRIPYRAADGSPNVAHRFISERAGQLRGVSRVGVLLKYAAQLAGTTEAHMVGKRLLACHAMFVRSTDPTIAKRFDDAGAILGPETTISPGMIGFLGEDADLITPNWSYQGSDFSEYVQAMLRPMCAAVGIPWQFAMMQLTDANLASARAAMDQSERVAERLQNQHHCQVTAIFDESIMREGITRRRLTTRSIRRAMRGSFIRPRTWSTDRLKDAKTAVELIAAGVSPSTALGLMGIDYQTEVKRAEQDRALLGQTDAPIDDPNEEGQE